MFARTLAVAASVALFSQVASAANKCVREYTVKGGDICDSISAANNVSTYQLAALNPGTINPDCSNLIAGQTLCLGSEGEDCAQTYVVKLDDTCDEVYKAGGVNATIFNLNNPQVNGDCTNIYVGEVLCLASEVRVPPAPGVPIHTEVAPTATLARPTKTPAPPAATTSAFSSAVATPAVTPAPAAAAAAPTTSAAAEEEDCEEFEVVEGDTDEDLPFCDELVKA